MLKIFGSVFLLLIASPFALASHFGDFHVVAGVGRAPGQAGSMWQTDIIIHNFQDTPLTVEMAFVESGLGQVDNLFPVIVEGAETVTIAPGATRVFSDLLRDHRGRTTALGALLIGGDLPFAVTGRVYNVEASGATIGQTVPAAHDFITTTAERGFIPGLIANTNFRSNLGFLAAAGAAEPLVVEIVLAGPGGATLGSRTFTIPAGSISHVQVSSTTITSTPFDNATAIIRIVSGAGDVAAYASIIDNRSNHAAFATSFVPSAASNRTESAIARHLEELRSE